MAEMLLYNDIKLPKLPEHDTKKYPYTFITCQQKESSEYGLRTLAYVCVCESPAIKISTGVAISKGVKYRSYRCANEAENAYRSAKGEELLPPMSEGFVPYLDERTATGNKMTYPAIWADHDILDTNGVVYMSASEPVPLITLTYEGIPKENDIVLGQLVRLSDTPYDLSSVDSVTMYNEGENVTIGADGLEFYLQPGMQGIMQTGSDMLCAMTVINDMEQEGVLLPKGTYGICAVPDMQMWTSKLEGATEIDGDILVIPDFFDSEEVSGNVVKVSDKIYDINSITKVAYMLNGSRVIWYKRDLEVVIAKNASYLRLRDTDYGLVWVVSTVGTCFRYEDMQTYVVGVWGAKEIGGGEEPTDSIGFIEYLVNPKYRMGKPFRGFIGWKLAQGSGGSADEPSLVSSDGYTLQDVNGLNLIPKEGK